MTCREVAEFLLDYSTGELPASVRETIDGHLSRCRNCREYLAQYLVTVKLTRDAFDEEEACDAIRGMPEELVAAILAARLR